jgi:uncharacterized RDD family membrane protein YckC
LATVEKPLTLDGTHAVLTPEYVEFNFVLAGIYSRFLAWLLDALIIGVTTGLVVAVLVILSVLTAGVTMPLVFIANFLIEWGYFILLESVWSGQTVGKRVFGLRVIQESGVRIGFYHAALRNLLRLADRLPILYLIGGTSTLFSDSHQRLGDMVAGTIVVRERRLKIPAAIGRPEGETALLSDPLFLSRVARLTTDEAEVIFAAAIRREELGMEARLKLFAEVSQRLQEDADFFKPPHLSDEKLVLLVAAALAAQSKEKKKKSLAAPRRRAA